jgi:hypothetical protein
MNLTDTSESAELKFKQILVDFFISVYDEKSLTSHGIEHHRRVWNYAKELTELTEVPDLKHDIINPRNLIIACYLHDIGMSVDPGLRHGHHSRDMCIRFLEMNHLEKSDFQDVLLAIEKHDNKEYKTSSGIIDLLTILSVADDLDAFGLTGVYRYSEIYLRRGIRPEEIGYKIMKNADGRFENFKNIFGFSEKLLQKHRMRYKTLINFFTEYNKQAGSYNFGSMNPYGYCGVIEVLSDDLQKNIPIAAICHEKEIYSNDQVIRCFFKELAAEFNSLVI